MSFLRQPDKLVAPRAGSCEQVYCGAGTLADRQADSLDGHDEALDCVGRNAAAHELR